MKNVSFITVELGNLVIWCELRKADNAHVLFFAFLRCCRIGTVSNSLHCSLCQRYSIDCITHLKLPVLLVEYYNTKAQAAAY